MYVYIYIYMLPLLFWTEAVTKCLCHIGHGTLSSERGAKGALWRCIWCFGGKVRFPGTSSLVAHRLTGTGPKCRKSEENDWSWQKSAKRKLGDGIFVSCFVLACWELDALLLKLQHSYRGWHCLVTSAQSLRWSSGHIWCWWLFQLFLRSRHQNTLC